MNTLTHHIFFSSLLQRNVVSPNPNLVSSTSQYATTRAAQNAFVVLTSSQISSAYAPGTTDPNLTR